MAESLALHFGSDLSGNSAFTVYYDNWTLSDGYYGVSVSVPANWQAVCFIVNTLNTGVWLSGAAILVTTDASLDINVPYKASSALGTYLFKFNTNSLRPGTAGNMTIKTGAYVAKGVYFAF